MTNQPDMNAIALDETDRHPRQSDIPDPCTCDDESTLIAVDFGPQDGGVVDMCGSCYAEMERCEGPR